MDDIIANEVRRFAKKSHLELMEQEDLEQELWVIALTARKKFSYDNSLDEDTNKKIFCKFIQTSLRNGFLNLRRKEFRPTLSEKTQREKDRVKNTINYGLNVFSFSTEDQPDIQTTINKLADRLTPELRIYFFRHIGGVKIPKTKLEKIKWLLNRDDSH